MSNLPPVPGMTWSVPEMTPPRIPRHHYYSLSLGFFKEARELCESYLSNIVRQHSDFASKVSSGPCLTASNHEIQENLPRDESVHQSCSALMITTDMPLTQDLSLIPKVCYSCPLSKSDIRILSTSRLKTRLATQSFGPRGHPESYATIITP